MTKRAAIYCRVSTQDQSDHGFSLPSQLEECRKYAAAHDMEVVAEFAEDVSGKVPMGEREQGRRLVQLFERREADAVIAHAVDRLSRDDLDARYMVRVWRRAGTEVHTGDVGKIESENDIVLVIKSWQSADELAKIRERTTRGKRAKAQSGRVVGTRAPYGYSITRDAKGKQVNFEVVESEAATIRQVFQWYTVGDGTSGPLAVTTIARRLSELRAPTPGETRPGFKRTRLPGMWHPQMVLRLLSAETYAGTWWYNVRICGTQKTRPMAERIAVPVPAIVSREVWDAAKAQRARNKQYAARNTKNEYLLRGLIRCACGLGMCGRFFVGHRYYTCNSRSNHHAALEPRHCRARQVRADAIEADVWDSLKGVFSNMARLEELLYQAQQAELAALTPQRDELDTVTAMLAECEQEAAETARALVKAAGVVGRALERDMQAVNRRHEALTRRRDELTAALAQVRLTDDAIRDAVRLAADVRAGLENADLETKRWVLELFQVEVVVKEGRFYVSCLAGDLSGTIRLLPGQRGYKPSQDVVANGLSAGLSGAYWQ